MRFTNSGFSVKAILAYLLGTLLVKGIGIITTPIFTRILTTEDYGVLVVFQTWVSCFAIFIGLQVSGSIATAKIRLPKKRFHLYLRNILGLAFLCFVTLSAVCVAFDGIIAPLLEVPEKLIPVLLLQAFGSSCAVFYISYTIQTKQPRRNVVFSSILALGNVAVSIPLILILEDDKYLGRIIGGTVMGLGATVFVYCKFYFGVKSANFKYSDWKFALPLSVPLIAHLLSNLLVGQSDRLFIVKYLDYEQAAIYSVAYAIGSIGLILTESSNNVWSPWYLENTKLNNSPAINRNSRYYTKIVSVVFSLIILVAPELMAFMAPPSYVSGTSSLVVVIVALYFKYLYRFPLAYEQYKGNLRWVALSTLICLAVNVLFNILLIPVWGIFGAAIATLISYIVLFVIHEFVARKVIGGYNIVLTQYLGSVLKVAFFALVTLALTNNFGARVLAVLTLILFFSYRDKTELGKIIKNLSIGNKQILKK